MMPRAENVFYNLVTDEDSTTELLCNLLRFSAFRTPFLRQFLPEAVAAEVAWEDCDTQPDLGIHGRPDMEIRNSEVAALIEIKVSPGLGLTANQPRGYLNFLHAQKEDERWLVFLVPKRWVYLDDLGRKLAAVDDGNSSAQQVRCRIILWEDVLDLLDESDLGALNPFMHDFRELLRARLGARPVSFTTKEILMLFSNEIPVALAGLQQVVDGVRGLSSTYKIKPSASHSLCPAEYGLYFLDANGRGVFWFGVWTNFWKATGKPLCFGLTEKCGETVRQAFLANYKGETKHYERYILGWFQHEVLAAENVVEEVWSRLSPLVGAVIAANEAEQAAGSATPKPETVA